MIDSLLLMTLSVLALIGWVLGATRKRAKFWVVFLAPIGVVLMLWYFFVILAMSQTALFTHGLGVGWPTLAAMIGGVWALLAKPKPEPPAPVNDGGAQSAC